MRDGPSSPLDSPTIWFSFRGAGQHGLPPYSPARAGAVLPARIDLHQREVRIQSMRQTLFALLAATSFALCVVVLLLYTHIIPQRDIFGLRDSFILQWYGQGPAIPPSPPAPELPDDALTNAASLEEAVSAMQSFLNARHASEQILADHYLVQLRRFPADDEGNQPTRWQYTASAPMLPAIPLTLAFPVWWCIRRFRSSAYSCRNAKAPASRIGARLTTTTLALTLCIALAVLHLRSADARTPGTASWCTSSGTLAGIEVAGGGVMVSILQRHAPQGTDAGPVVERYHGEWLWGRVQVGRVRYAAATSVLILFPTFVLHVLVTLLALRTATRLSRELRRVHRINKGLCSRCGYDLRGSQERCSECGTPIPAPVGTSTANA